MPHDHDHPGSDHFHARTKPHAHAGAHAGAGHDHHAPPERPDLAFALGMGLNAALVAAQIGVGIAAGSMALLSDAVHNLGDVLGLGLAWGAAWLGRLGPRAGRTYGFGRSSILAALANAVILLVGVGGIAVESVRRLLHPGTVEAGPVMITAAAGIVVNGLTALLFLRGRGHDMNIRGAFQHMAGDAAISAGVLAAAFVVQRTGLPWIDPVVSLGIAALIAATTWNLLAQSTNLALDAVPQGLDEAEIARFLAGLPGVCEVHDLHVWALSTTEVAVTVHLVRRPDGSPDRLVHDAVEGLSHRFGIGHSTIQVETEGQAEGCVLRPAGVV
jgi:cobalt-zinc-cadmium efflux system protein